MIHTTCSCEQKCGAVLRYEVLSIAGFDKYLAISISCVLKNIEGIFNGICLLSVPNFAGRYFFTIICFP